MKDEIVSTVLQEMMPLLDTGQSATLKEVLRAALCAYDIRRKETALMCTNQNGQNYLQVFLETFRQNGKSEGTISQYRLHISHLLAYLGKNVEDIEDDDLIDYMHKYRQLRRVSGRYLNNMRLVFNTFFRWLQRRKVIMRNPVDGLEPIKYRKDGEEAPVPGGTGKGTLRLRTGEGSGNRGIPVFFCSPGIGTYPSESG